MSLIIPLTLQKRIDNTRLYVLIQFSLLKYIEIMEHLLEFIKNHWYLWLAFFVILGLIAFEETRKSVRGIRRLAPDEVVNLMNHHEATVIDLREHASFSHGHILGSINLHLAPADDLTQKIEPYKNKSLILLAKDDLSALSFGTKLQKLGIAKIYLLKGGLAAWKNAGLPLTKK